MWSLLGDRHVAENRNDSVISNTQPSSLLHPSRTFATPFSSKNCVPLIRFSDGGLESIDFRFSIPVPFLLSLAFLFLPKVFLQLQQLQSSHPKPLTKQGHFVLFFPLTSVQETASSFFFFCPSPHLQLVITLPFFIFMLPQLRHLQISDEHRWPRLTQGHLDLSPKLGSHANFCRDVILLPQRQPFLCV